MSIMGAITVGVVGGDLAKDLIFNYTKKQYQDKITELQSLISRLEKHLAELENLRAEVNSFWKDAAGSSAIVSLDRTIATTKIKTDHARALMETFQKTVEDMDQSQSGLDAALDTAKTILGALGS